MCSRSVFRARFRIAIFVTRIPALAYLRSWEVVTAGQHARVTIESDRAILIFRTRGQFIEFEISRVLSLLQSIDRVHSVDSIVKVCWRMKGYACDVDETMGLQRAFVETWGTHERYNIDASIGQCNEAFDRHEP